MPNLKSPVPVLYDEVFKRSGVPREVFKWLQSLDLTCSVKNIRRDFANGFYIAELLSWYFPLDVPMVVYRRGISAPIKLANWSRLQRRQKNTKNFFSSVMAAKLLFSKKRMRIPKELIEGTIHCKFGAADLLIQLFYSLLTKREPKLAEKQTLDFMNQAYQARLPMHARCTAATAVKGNIYASEYVAKPDMTTNELKARAILNEHMTHRRLQRTEDPHRFGIRPTLGELALRFSSSERRSSPQKPAKLRPKVSISSVIKVEGEGWSSTTLRTQLHNDKFRHIQVQQMDKTSQMSLKFGNRNNS